jgi:hypothetical protein
MHFAYRFCVQKQLTRTLRQLAEVHTINYVIHSVLHSVIRFVVHSVIHFVIFEEHAAHPSIMD